MAKRLRVVQCFAVQQNWSPDQYVPYSISAVDTPIIYLVVKNPCSKCGPNKHSSLFTWKPVVNTNRIKFTGKTSKNPKELIHGARKLWRPPSSPWSSTQHRHFQILNVESKSIASFSGVYEFSTEKHSGMVNRKRSVRLLGWIHGHHPDDFAGSKYWLV